MWGVFPPRNHPRWATLHATGYVCIVMIRITIGASGCGCRVFPPGNHSIQAAQGATGSVCIFPVGLQKESAVVVVVVLVVVFGT
eukprot:996907-Pyramimonas_sp.AAC.1